MANSESLRQVAHSRAPLSTWLGIVLLFALFGAIVLVIIGPLPRGSDYEETRAKKRIENLKALREEADKALTTYSWVDKNKGVARIPIERAMELTVADLAKQKPMQAGPIATPAPAEGTAGKPEPQATAGAARPAPASPAPAGSPQSGGTSSAASPASHAPASVSPAAQSSSPNPALPSPTKSP
jgi:hypothetical protein